MCVLEKLTGAIDLELVISDELEPIDSAEILRVHVRHLPVCAFVFPRHVNDGTTRSKRDLLPGTIRDNIMLITPYSANHGVVLQLPREFRGHGAIGIAGEGRIDGEDVGKDFSGGAIYDFGSFLEDKECLRYSHLMCDSEAQGEWVGHFDKDDVVFVALQGVESGNEMLRMQSLVSVVEKSSALYTFWLISLEIFAHMDRVIWWK